MELLCIDIGNTQTHFAVMDASGLVRMSDKWASRSLEASSNEIAGVLESIADKGINVQAVACCSVVPAATRRLKAALKGVVDTVFELTYQTCPPWLRIHYPQPSEIGQDRLANAIAVHVLYDPPVMILDIGTALTVDIITRSGGYEGGWIAPGLKLMGSYLKQHTALLPATDLALTVPTATIGKSTQEAIRLGCSIGFLGMVEALIDKAAQVFDQKGEGLPTVVATGGDGEPLTQYPFQTEIRFEPYLTLKGLKEAFLQR